MDFEDMWPVYTKCDFLPFLRLKKKQADTGRIQMKAQTAQSLQIFFIWKCAVFLQSIFGKESLINVFFLFFQRLAHSEILSPQYKVSKFLVLLLKATLQLKIPFFHYLLWLSKPVLIKCFNSVVFPDCFVMNMHWWNF